MINLVEQAQSEANRTRVPYVIYNSPFGGQCFARKSQVGFIIEESSVISTVYPRLLLDEEPEKLEIATKEQFISGDIKELTRRASKTLRELGEERVKEVAASFTRTETCTVEEALDFASHAHKGQVRTEGSDRGLPYVIHCIRVSSALWPHEHGTILALLHDILEDVEGSYVRECPTGDFYLFANDRILYIAEPVAKGLEILTREKGKRYRKYIEEIAHSECVPAIMVKCEDLADNLRHKPNKSLEIRYRRALEHLERKVSRMKALKQWPTLAT